MSHKILFCPICHNKPELQIVYKSDGYESDGYQYEHVGNDCDMTDPINDLMFLRTTKQIALKAWNEAIRKIR